MPGFFSIPQFSLHIIFLSLDGPTPKLPLQQSSDSLLLLFNVSIITIYSAPFSLLPLPKLTKLVSSSVFPLLQIFQSAKYLARDEKNQVFHRLHPDPFS